MASSGKDVKWYRPFGVNSIRDMAVRLGDEGMYKVFYAQYSQATHGLSLEQQLHFNVPHSEVVFDHIRRAIRLGSPGQNVNTAATAATAVQAYELDEIGAWEFADLKTGLVHVFDLVQQVLGRNADDPVGRGQIG